MLQSDIYHLQIRIIMQSLSFIHTHTHGVNKDFSTNKCLQSLILISSN